MRMGQVAGRGVRGTGHGLPTQGAGMSPLPVDAIPGASGCASSALSGAHCRSPHSPLLLFLALLLLSLPAFAQRIQVEVIVFAYANPDAGAALSADDPDPVFEGMLLGAEGDAYQLLPDSALRLNGANDALARHARTRSLVHIGWQQDAGATREIRLRGRNTIKLNDPAHTASAENPELDGDISLRFGRSVEVHLDALLRLQTRDSAGRPNGQQRFRLNSKRILNYGELHYLDHPALGAIVRVDQVEAGQ